MPMNIIILDDYQDAVRKLKCAAKLEHLNAKVFTNTVKGIGQLSVRLRDADVLVLIRERTQFPRQLLEKLPKLKLISQTGKVGSHIDVATCTRMTTAIAPVRQKRTGVGMRCRNGMRPSLVRLRRDQCARGARQRRDKA